MSLTSYRTALSRRAKGLLRLCGCVKPTKTDLVYAAAMRPRKNKITTSHDRLAALREGRELPVTVDDLVYSPVGQVPGPEVRAVLELASALHRSRSSDCAVSWGAQEEAREFFNKNGLAATLTRIFELQPTEAEE